MIGNGYVRSIAKLKWKDPYFIGTLFDFHTGRIRAFVHDTRTRTTTTSDPGLDVNDVTDEGTKNKPKCTLTRIPMGDVYAESALVA